MMPNQKKCTSFSGEHQVSLNPAQEDPAEEIEELKLLNSAANQVLMVPSLSYQHFSNADSTSLTEYHVSFLSINSVNFNKYCSSNFSMATKTISSLGFKQMEQLLLF